MLAAITPRKTSRPREDFMGRAGRKSGKIMANPKFDEIFFAV
jgi:hypothetical protein